jgi:hypothetical protein
MTKKWIKLGLIFSPDGIPRHPKLLTHAANPLPLLLNGDVYRVFFSGRDAANRSSVGAVDVDVVKRQLVETHFSPVFEHGSPGSFYADGVSIGSCYTVRDKRYMLFMGWQNSAHMHWRGDIGRLLVDSKLILTLDSSEPFFGVDPTDPISLSYPWVIDAGNCEFQMWYGSTLAWDTGNGEMLHVIQQASSRDGHFWTRKGLAVPYQFGVAQAFSRPTVVRGTGGDLEMWFSYRGKRGQTYRIGFARQRFDGRWELLLDQSGIDVSASGWDSEMIEYPYVFDHLGERYMFYNGNGYGRSGFGLAILEN